MRGRPRGVPRFFLLGGNFGGPRGVPSEGSRRKDAAMADLMHAAGLFAAVYLALILIRFA
ncbi:hypothetical protein HRbin29_02141 [bacterium HR29]|nr:hypothetical protein HRbin29_02141 [bacterium HR29]